MLGELGRSGVGEPVVVDRVKSVAELRAKCGTSNAALIGQLRADSNACELLKLTRDDAALGRMTAPTPLSDHNAHLLPEVLLNPRFGVVKEKENGEVKIRAVDHLSWSPGTVEAGDESRPSKRARRDSSVNGYTSPAEKMSHDTVDGLDAVLRHFFEVVGAVPGMFKVCVVVVWLKGGVFCVVHALAQADIDSAFRRIPVAPEHRWACWIAFVAGDQVFVSQHATCPFGAVASVHAWERVGAAIAHVAKKFLKLAVLRYVDDFFAPERCVHINSKTCV